MWKVYNIQTGRIIKAGFDSDDQAKDWLERRKDLVDDEFDIDEMDEEEEEEYLENDDAEDDEEVVAAGEFEPEAVVDPDDTRDITYPDDGVAATEDDDDDDEAETEDEEEEDEVETEDEDDKDDDY